MIGLLATITSVLYLAVAVLLVGKFRRTRDAGFIWLGMPLVVLPFIALPLAFWLQAGIDRLALGGQVNGFPFSLVAQGRLSMGVLLTLLNLVQHVIWGFFALVSVLVLMPRRENVEG